MVRETILELHVNSCYKCMDLEVDVVDMVDIYLKPSTRLGLDIQAHSPPLELAHFILLSTRKV